MKNTNYRSFENGYSSFSRSFRATVAESEGKKPLTRAAKATGIPASVIKAVFEPSEWHHVGKYAARVDYYDCDAILDAAFDEDDTFLAIVRAMGPRQRRTFMGRVATYRLAKNLQPAGVCLPVSHFDRRDAARSRRVSELQARRPDLHREIAADICNRLSDAAFAIFIEEAIKSKTEKRVALRVELERCENCLARDWRAGCNRPITTENQRERLRASIARLQAALA